MREYKLNTAGGLILAAVAGAFLNTSSAAVSVHNGEAVPLGNGTANTYLVLEDDNTPVAVGIRLSESALEGLPAEPNNTGRCFDKNGDGVLEAGVDCLGDYETVMKWPTEIGRTNLPFTWIGLNWNAKGHGPAHVYDLPHFDAHFFMVDKALIASIRPGPCGEWVDCEDFERASLPLDPRFVPAGHADVGAVVAQMGNHLVNTRSPELSTPPETFTHTLIYGAYDRQIIFIEPMVTREFLAGRPDTCAPISQPEAWQRSASYPTQYCIRHLPQESAVTISLEGFVDRKFAMDIDETGRYPELS